MARKSTTVLALCPCALDPIALGPIALGPIALGLIALGLAALGPTALGIGAARASELEVRFVAKGACLSQNETREEIKSRHLLEPFAVLKAAAAQFKAEALSAKLCRAGEELVYEIALLHRDGRLLHVVTNASTGKLLAARNAREPIPKN